MFQKIINFIKYHNAFTISLAVIFVFSGVIFASEDVRNTVIGEKIISEQGIDNSQLLSADLENFDMVLKIQNIQEDDKNYYIDYSFNTIAVKDNVWQSVVKSERFTVNKSALGDRDLGIYLAEEFSEETREEMTYLKKAQKTERERGRAKVVKTTDYTGLIGLTLDLKNKILAGYKPVVKPLAIETAQVSKPLINKEPEEEPPIAEEPEELVFENETDEGVSSLPETLPVETTTSPDSGISLPPVVSSTSPPTTPPIGTTSEGVDGVQ